MDFNRLKRFFATVKYLKARQVYYRVFYIFKRRLYKNKTYRLKSLNYRSIVWKDEIYNYTSYNAKKLSFKFLNISHSFEEEIDWNYQKYGKLWTYNLVYFDFLSQKGITKKNGLILIKDFISRKNDLIDANEPYPISLRCINWIKFLSKNKIYNRDIDNILYSDLVFLSKNLEYHILANHLLENAFSLLFGSYYFQNKKLYNISEKLIKLELNEQILEDGAHYELSPMYHQSLLLKLLDCINLITMNNEWVADDLLIFLQKKASSMLSWLRNITYINGDVPMVNDSTFKVAPSSKNLFYFAEKLKISTINLGLSDSGYRKIKSKKYELFLDVGNIGPDYQPGHAHSDTLSFELRINGSPFLVDTGISTYEKSNKRQRERETASHNTVKIKDKEQSDVWGGFRVGKRAKIKKLLEEANSITASHDGYDMLGITHERTFKYNKTLIEIKDSLSKTTKAKAIFHLHSSINRPRVQGKTVIFKDIGASIYFDRHSNINIQSYKLSHGFNFVKSAHKIIVDFERSLITQIRI